MTHILRIDEMAKFGRRSVEEVERQNEIDEFVKQVSAIYGDVLEDVKTNIEAFRLRGFNEKLNIQPIGKGNLNNDKDNPLYMFTSNDLKDEPLCFSILNFFDDTADIVGSDKGEYAEETTSLVALESNGETDPTLRGYTVYLLAVLGYNDDIYGVDYGYLENRMMNGELENDVYNALKKVKTNAFCGGMWNASDLSDGDFIYIPMQVNLVGNDMNEISNTIKKEVRNSIFAAYKALSKGLEGYLIKNNPQGLPQKEFDDMMKSMGR